MILYFPPPALENYKSRLFLRHLRARGSVPCGCSQPASSCWAEPGAHRFAVSKPNPTTQAAVSILTDVLSQRGTRLQEVSIHLRRLMRSLLLSSSPPTSGTSFLWHQGWEASQGFCYFSVISGSDCLATHGLGAMAEPPQQQARAWSVSALKPP